MTTSIRADEQIFSKDPRKPFKAGHKLYWRQSRMEPYRQSIPAIGLSLERGIPGVPADGYYYVVLQGEIRGRHRTLASAKQQYKTLLRETGWTPPAVEKQPVDHGKDAVEAYMDGLEDYWGSSHKHARPGGKAMYRR